MIAENKAVGKRVRGDFIVVIVVVCALVVGAAYYQEQLFSYWRLHGWESGAVGQTVERFIQEAYNGQTSAGDLLDPDFCQPVVEKGKFVGVRHPGPVGPAVTRVTKFLPEGKAAECRVRIKPKAGLYQADVRFSNGQWAPFDVSRAHGKLRIRRVPDVLRSTQPPVEPWD